MSSIAQAARFLAELYVSWLVACVQRPLSCEIYVQYLAKYIKNHRSSVQCSL
jgi:hypothetical protein